MGRVQTDPSSQYTPEAEAGYGQDSVVPPAAAYESTYTPEPSQPMYEAPPQNETPVQNEPPIQQQYPPSQPPQYPPPPPPQYPPPPPPQYPPQPAAYPPSQPQQYQQPVQFPPPNPAAAAGPQQYHQQAPPMSPYQQNSGAPAPGYPLQNPQFQPYYVKPVGTKPWSTGLFDCMEDPNNALITACFPCLTFGQIAEIIDSGHTTCGTSGLMYGAIAFCIAMPCLLSCTYRTKLRTKYELMEAPAPDWVTHFLCEWCALCQEYRELKNRGWDPEIGWHANVARQNQNVAMTPPMHQTMMG